MKTERLLLRDLRMTDAERLARLTNDPFVLRNLMRTANHFTANDARKLILRTRQRQAPVWGIDDGALVGVIGLVGEFGLWLGRTAWGHGYGEEAGRAVVAHAFEAMGLCELKAAPIADNKASRHLLIKLGFRQTGRSVAWCRERKKMVPLVHFRLSSARA